MTLFPTLGVYVFNDHTCSMLVHLTFRQSRRQIFFCYCIHVFAKVKFLLHMCDYFGNEPDCGFSIHHPYVVVLYILGHNHQYSRKHWIRLIGCIIVVNLVYSSFTNKNWCRLPYISTDTISIQFCAHLDPNWPVWQVLSVPPLLSGIIGRWVGIHQNFTSLSFIPPYPFFFVYACLLSIYLNL